MTDNHKSLDLGGGLVVRYRQTPRRRQKNAYLRIDDDGSLTVSTPWDFSIKKVEAFIREKRAWILKHRSRKCEFGRHNPDAWHPCCRLWFRGRSHPVQKRAAKRNRLIRDDEAFVFECADEAAFGRVQHAWYKKMAEIHITKRVRHWSEKMGLRPEKISFRRYKSRWGCCTAGNELIFNTRLICYDDELIDYVVVHELAHIPHKNHGKSFWSLVEAHIPDWRERRKRLV